MKSFWLEDIQQLFEECDTLPHPSMTLEQQMNAITRLVFIVWFVMYVLNYKYHSVFALNSLLFIIILYYIQRNSMKENYTNCDTLPIEDWVKIPKGNDLRIQTQSQYRFCNDAKDIYYDNRMFSTNQALAGGANPKTTQKPVIIPPSHAWDFWSEDYVVPSHINDSTHQELFLSGYVGSSTCGSDLSQPPPSTCRTKEQQGVSNPVPIIENYNRLYPHPAVPASQGQHQWINGAGTPGDMVDDVVYNPEQMMKHNIPSNLPAGACEQESIFDEYNKNLHTQMFGPNEFVQHEVIEPIHANMGITHTQQLPPMTYEQDINGVKYVSHDSRVIPPQPQPIPQQPIADHSNVYDPRSFGYGTSYRSYVHDLTGQPRFFYDDITSVRRPNFIVRSNIDHAKWAQSYGPMDTNQAGEVAYQAGHQLAENQFLQDTLQQRGELQERAMRKKNAESWQRRQFPIRRDQARRI